MALADEMFSDPPEVVTLAGVRHCISWFPSPYVEEYGFHIEVSSVEPLNSSDHDAGRVAAGGAVVVVGPVVVVGAAVVGSAAVVVVGEAVVAGAAVLVGAAVVTGAAVTAAAIGTVVVRPAWKLRSLDAFQFWWTSTAMVLAPANIDDTGRSYARTVDSA